MSDLPVVLKDRATILLGLGAAGGIGTFITFGSWLPTFYAEQFGYSLERAGSLAALLSFCAIIGSLLGATLPARFPRRRPFLITAGLLIPVVGLGCFASSSPVLLYPSVALFGILGAVFMPVIFTIPMELPHMTPERVGVTVAAVLSVANLSGFAAPLFVGFLRDQTAAFSLGLGVVALSALSLAIAGYLLPETGGHRTGPPLLDAADRAPSCADGMLPEQPSAAP
jgi:cyanate permease